MLFWVPCSGAAQVLLLALQFASVHDHLPWMHIFSGEQRKWSLLQLHRVSRDTCPVKTIPTDEVQNTALGLMHQESFK
jgi:hypothetical protein